MINYLVSHELIDIVQLAVLARDDRLITHELIDIVHHIFTLWHLQANRELIEKIQHILIFWRRNEQSTAHGQRMSDS